MIRLVFPMLLAAMAGAGGVLQSTVNSQLRFHVGSPAWAGLISFTVGTLCMIAYVTATRDAPPTVAAMAKVPWWGWIGGLLGALYIAAAILLVPRLGAATMISCIVAGQMVAAVLFDQFGLFGLAQRNLDLPRLAGIALVIGGVVLIRR